MFICTRHTGWCLDHQAGWWRFCMKVWCWFCVQYEDEVGPSAPTMSTLIAAVMIFKGQINYQIRQPTSYTPSPYRCNGPAVSFTINLKSAEQFASAWEFTAVQTSTANKTKLQIKTSGRVDSWCYNYILNGSLEEGQPITTPHLAAKPLKIAKKD